MVVNRKEITFLATFFVSLYVGCTGAVPGSFRFIQQTQSFSATLPVDTKIDLLWIVDNSSSMDAHQDKLRAGFASFANKYLKPTWDIRVAVITTDTYLANSAFSGYLNRTVSGSVDYYSTYLSNLTWIGTYSNPSSDLTLVGAVSTPSPVPSPVPTSGGYYGFPHGFTYGQLNPLWGTDYSLLKPGIHDGPIRSFCFEVMPYFLKSVTACTTRDNPAGNRGVDRCISPGVGEDAKSQCVNTTQNDTVRSGKAIISTIPPSGTPGDTAWVTQLINDFMVNASVGSSGSGSERGLSSLLQFINDNEANSSTTAFFRSGSVRGIVFLSDEDDQSMTLPSPVPTNFSPTYGYSTSCSPKTVDAYTYTLGTCVDSASLISVSSVKETLDSFFLNLDSSGSDGTPNYFVATITPMTGSSISAIHSSRVTIDAAVGIPHVTEGERSDRYLALGTLVGNGSISYDIANSDYTPVLDQIGAEVVLQKSTYTLTRAPTSQEDMIITVIHGDGTNSVVPNSEYVISGKNIIFSNASFVLSLAATDTVSINYQPKTAN